MRIFILLLLTTLLVIPVNAQETSVSPTVTPGDTWTALAYRYNLPEETLRVANPQMNRQRQPVIGTTIAIPEGAVSQNGRLLRRNDGDLLAAAVALNTSPWTLALQNGMPSPYRPPLYRPLYLPGGAEPPQDLPSGITRLELSQAPAQPGQALGVRGKLWEEGMVTAVLDGNEMDIFQNGNHFLALTGTGAFYGSGQPELTIRVDDSPLWSQPWQFIDPDDWVYQQITLTGEAAQIDQESIARERERLNAIWQQNSPAPQWQTAYQLPITDYLEITSPFGARRSYNGGPYRSYHEGVDFSAYGGTPVMAPAAGTVVLAEKLFVRGNAVIIDHGLGVYSGFYHMSGIDTTVGEQVQPGQIVGAVGTTGLSTGNHLHWDLLVDGIWVDGQAWLNQGMGCWILEGWGGDCEIGDS
ncbi:MAG: LysM peptidoglycan-binding domain-containing M23 family metallopeptidase [Chloroflexi bacterium]|nr:LysM peptidoglycan-binding domain-containing M23 family metallopeptidase [Chloroflexota bacterium]